MLETPEDMLLAYVASLFLAVALKGRKYLHCIGEEAKARANRAVSLWEPAPSRYPVGTLPFSFLPVLLGYKMRLASSVSLSFTARTERSPCTPGHVHTTLVTTIQWSSILVFALL